jgi:predicted Zn-dependent peptidase
MAGYSGRYYFDEVIDDYDAIPDRIRAVTKKRIVEASERMFSDKIGGLGMLGDSKSRALG